MAGTKSPLVEEMSNFYEALCLDLPSEAARTMLGQGSENELRKAGWKAYDAWVSLANEFTNLAYTNRLLGEITGRTMESALRLRQVGGYLSSALLGNLWPALGLPTHNELLAIREELLALRQELAARETTQPAAVQTPSVEASPDDQTRRIFNGLRRNGSPSALRSNRERKTDAAA